MKLVCTFLLGLAFCLSSANPIEDPSSYYDEVLTKELPRAIKDDGLELYELPNFSHNFQERTDDGFESNTKVQYHAGNLTGLGNARRGNCQSATWRSGNISAECTVVFPQLNVKYESKFLTIKGIDNGVHVRGHDYGVKGTIKDLEASLDITSSPSVKIPSLKNFQITKQGTPELIFETDADIGLERLSTHFYHKLTEFLYELFEGKLKDAVNDAVGSVRYPTA